MWVDYPIPLLGRSASSHWPDWADGPLLCPVLLTRAAVHRFLEDLQLVIELGDEGALAERARDEASLQLVGDVLPGSQLLVVLSRLGQQLQSCDTLALQGNGVQGPGAGLQTSVSLQPADRALL